MNLNFARNLTLAVASLAIGSTANAQLLSIDTGATPSSFTFGSHDGGSSTIADIGGTDFLLIDLPAAENTGGGTGFFLPGVLDLPDTAILEIDLTVGGANTAPFFQILLNDQDMNLGPNSEEQHIFDIFLTSVVPGEITTVSFNTNSPAASQTAFMADPGDEDANDLNLPLFIFQSGFAGDAGALQVLISEVRIRVPEPSSVGLLLVGGLGAVIRGRRRA